MIIPKVGWVYVRDDRLFIFVCIKIEEESGICIEYYHGKKRSDHCRLYSLGDCYKQLPLTKVIKALYNIKEEDLCH